MTLIIHIVIAVASVAFTTLLFVLPTRTKFRINYALIGLTLATGTYLVISTNTPMLKACMSGLFYITLATAGTVAARHRYARREAQQLQ